MTFEQAVAEAITALGFAEVAVSSYRHYPNEEFRQQRIDEVCEARRVLRAAARATR